MSRVGKFEDLEVWQLAREICCDIEILFKTTPLGKRYILLNQMDGSSGSIMDNIAEGFGRDGKLELRNFLGIAKGSCNELKSQLFRARDKDLITSAQFTVLAEKCEKEIGKLGAFIAYLNRTEYQGIKFKRNHSQQKNKPPEPAIE